MFHWTKCKTAESLQVTANQEVLLWTKPLGTGAKEPIKKTTNLLVRIDWVLLWLTKSDPKYVLLKMLFLLNYMTHFGWAGVYFHSNLETSLTFLHVFPQEKEIWHTTLWLLRVPYRRGSDHKAIPNLKKGEEEQSCHVLGKRGPEYLGTVLPIIKTSRAVISLQYILLQA